MTTALLLALAVAAQADESPAPPATSGPGLHRVRVVGPRELWVWSVETADGKFRPVEYRPAPGPEPAPAPAPARPAFETNGVLVSHLASDGRKIRASDARTLAEVTAIAEAARRKPEPPADPGPTAGPPEAPWSELILFAVGAALCILGVLIAVRSALRPR